MLALLAGDRSIYTIGDQSSVGSSYSSDWKEFSLPAHLEPWHGKSRDPVETDEPERVQFLHVLADVLCERWGGYEGEHELEEGLQGWREVWEGSFVEATEEGGEVGGDEGCLFVFAAKKGQNRYARERRRLRVLHQGDFEGRDWSAGRMGHDQTGKSREREGREGRTRAAIFVASSSDGREIE